MWKRLVFFLGNVNFGIRLTFALTPMSRLLLGTAHMKARTSLWLGLFCNNFSGASGLFRSSYHLRSVARNIGILEQNALTMKWLQSVSAIRNVRVGYEPFIFIDCIVNQVQFKESDSGSLA